MATLARSPLHLRPFVVQAAAIFVGTGKPDTRGYPSGAGADTGFYPWAYLRRVKAGNVGMLEGG
jgi:hypothetical protein